jgi:DNA-binding response OmpR family regulator
MAADHEASAAQGVRPTGTGPALRALAVDDEPGLLKMMTLALEQTGYAVTAVGDGTAARRLIQQERFDLLVTDIFLPDVDGLQLITLLRQVRPETKVIVVSAGGTYSASPFAMTMAKKMGVQKVLNKPFEAAELVQTITELNGAST